MDPLRRPRLKVCCIQDARELSVAVAAGADAVGLVSRMPSGPGPISEQRIAELARTVPPGVSAFLLTSEQGAAAVAAQCALTGVDTVQLCDRMSEGAWAALRTLTPAVRLVQVIHVTGPESVDEAVAAAEQVDALLLDSGRLDADVKELGGTGRVHDWSVSRQIRERCAVPLFLAGGLNAGNVREAIEVVGPFGLDICSGVRRNGLLDAALLEAFVAAAGL